MHLPFPFLVLLGLAAAHPPSKDTQHTNPHSSLTVHTTSGRVHGKIDPVTPRVRQFLGIPFAQPPLDDLRFLPPQPLSQPRADIDATTQPPSCMQYLSNRGDSIYVREIYEFNLQGLNTTGAISEDCLALNIWTPINATDCSSDPSKGLPVLIFIYGGGFSTGGVDVPYQIPSQWIDRTRSHIVLSFNYRVNIFGYPNAPASRTKTRAC